jgi:hypothetical protein
MAERRSKCPKCFALDPKVLEVLDPDTQNMNSKARLECWDCLHTWEGHVTSKHHQEQRAKGFVI